MTQFCSRCCHIHNLAKWHEIKLILPKFSSINKTLNRMLTAAEEQMTVSVTDDGCSVKHVAMS